ncbi:hypothetical protein HDR61_00430 [bacterium]|nr:hypothetical protein [bacterium]
MNINLTCVMLVLETTPNPDIRKSDIQNIKILLRRDTHGMPWVAANTSDDIKQQVRNTMAGIIGTGSFALEQVYAMGDKKYMAINNGVDIIHLGIINGNRIENIHPEYELADISIKGNKIKIGDMEYQYQTVEKIGPAVEYLFETNAPDIETDKTLVEILSAWKHLRNRVENTDTIFKFMPDEFALESVRQVYEIISGRCVDKSNFHKKITKYCTEIPNKTTRRGHRPGKLYTFKAKTGDSWL